MMNHHYISKNNPLVLASISPRRKAILTQIGIPFEPVGSMTDETVCTEMKVADLACQMATRKAESVQRAYKNRWILGADTLVALDKQVFGKPKDAHECHTMLLHLSGRTHRVITGFCVLIPEARKYISRQL